jgi:hypothetical protein
MKNGLLGRKGFVVLQPADGVVSEILAQVIIVMAAGGLRRMNNSCISLLTPPGTPAAWRRMQSFV